MTPDQVAASVEARRQAFRERTGITLTPWRPRSERAAIDPGLSLVDLLVTEDSRGMLRGLLGRLNGRT